MSNVYKRVSLWVFYDKVNTPNNVRVQLGCSLLISERSSDGLVGCVHNDNCNVDHTK